MQMFKYRGFPRVIKIRGLYSIGFSVIIFAMMMVPAILLTVHNFNLQKEYANYQQTCTYLEKYFVWNAEFKVTFYTLSPKECGKKRSHRHYGITSSGTKAIPFRTVAVDNRYVKKGSILIDVESGMRFVAEDTGSGVKGHKIDIFVGEGTEENVRFALDNSGQYRRFIVLETTKEPSNIKQFTQWW